MIRHTLQTMTTVSQQLFDAVNALEQQGYLKCTVAQAMFTVFKSVDAQLINKPSNEDTQSLTTTTPASTSDVCTKTEVHAQNVCINLHLCESSPAKSNSVTTVHASSVVLNLRF